MRKKIFDIIVEQSDNNDKFSKFYDLLMIACIILSIIPLTFKRNLLAFTVIDKICAVVFIVDYILRWVTADYKYKQKSALSFIRYPFSFMAIVDLLSILPSLTALNNGFKLLRMTKIFRTIRVIRVFKAIRYSKSVNIIVNVFKSSKEPLIAVGSLAIGYILISAIIIFNVEPESFVNFFDAVYWATVSLTTVGYGDIYPITTIGRAVAMVSSMFGIAIVALPAGIITAGYMTEIQKK